MLVEKVEDIERDMAELPDKKDLHYQTQSINSQILNIKDDLAKAQREATDKAARNRWLLGILVPVIFTIAMAVFKKLGLL